MQPKSHVNKEVSSGMFKPATKKVLSFFYSTIKPLAKHREYIELSPSTRSGNKCIITKTENLPTKKEIFELDIPDNHDNDMYLQSIEHDLLWLTTKY